jgi:hypothetical protein
MSRFMKWWLTCGGVRRGSGSYFWSKANQREISEQLDKHPEPNPHIAKLEFSHDRTHLRVDDEPAPVPMWMLAPEAFKRTADRHTGGILDELMCLHHEFGNQFARLLEIREQIDDKLDTAAEAHDAVDKAIRALVGMEQNDG